MYMIIRPEEWEYDLKQEL